MHSFAFILETRPRAFRIPLHFFCQRPKFKVVSFGSCMILSSPTVVIRVQPYRSMHFNVVMWFAISSKPLSVTLEHWPMFKVVKSCKFLTTLFNPSSLIWQALKLSTCTRKSPWAMCTNAWSPTRSQKLTSQTLASGFWLKAAPG